MRPMMGNEQFSVRLSTNKDMLDMYHIESILDQ